MPLGHKAAWRMIREAGKEIEEFLNPKRPEWYDVNESDLPQPDNYRCGDVPKTFYPYDNQQE